jgi:integrase
MNNSTESKPQRKPPTKPDKPRPSFPLFSHQGSGQWAKKIRKRLVYFGSWRNDPKGEAALERFEKEWPYLKKGETPPAVDVSDGCTLRVLCNEFLRNKEAKLKAGDLSYRSFRGYFDTCEQLIDHFGKERRVDDIRSDDFRAFRAELAQRLNPTSLKNRITRCRSVFDYAHRNQLVDKPVSYGSNFDRPSALAIRRDRNRGGAKLFERDEVLRILDAADVQLKAMILLGVNCGFGNSDVASLPQSAVNLNTGWIEFPRVKTEIARRIPLWPETVAALKAAVAVRHPAADPSVKELCFLTHLGRPWVRVKAKAKKADQTNAEPGPKDFIPIDALSQAFGKLLKRLDINGRRGLGFYSLRHCFETFAGEAKRLIDKEPDQVAIDAIMGHADSSMAANYRHRISDERLRDVVETVRAWLFSPVSPEETTEEKLLKYGAVVSIGSVERE